MNLLTNRLLMGLCLAVLALILLSPLRDYDLGYHLATGRMVIQQQQIPEEDSFSFTHPSGFWPCEQWLSATILYGAYQGMGFPGIFAAKAILVLLCGLLLFLACREYGEFTDSGDISGLLSLTALLLAQERFLSRPLLFSLALFCALCWLLSKSRAGSMGKRVLEWSVFGVFALWGHLHAGWLFGAILIFMYGLGELLQDRKVPARLWIATGLGILMNFASVGALKSASLYGLFQPFFFLENRFYLRHVLEFQPAGLRTHVLIFLVFIPTSIGCFVFRRRLPWAWILPWLAFSYAGCRVQRVMSYSLFLLPMLWCEILKSSPEKIWRPKLLLGIRAAAGVVAVLTLSRMHLESRLDVTRDLLSPGVRSERFPSALFNPDVIPTDAFAFIAQSGIHGRVFNEDAWGGYLAHYFYPQSEIFIDNRLPVYGSIFYEKVYGPLLRGTDPGWLKQFHTDDIQWVILRNEIGSGRLQDALLRQPEWGLVYLDDTAVVFVRKAGVNATVFSEHGLRSVAEILIPGVPKTEDFLEDLNTLRARKKSVSVQTWLGNTYFERNQADLARQAWLEGLSVDSCNWGLLWRLGVLDESLQATHQAQQWYRRAARCGGEMSVYQNLSHMLMEHNQILRSSRTLKLGKKISGLWAQSS